MTRRVVSRGTVAVDPSKAVEKMRAYQLVDPRQWVLEVIRVAVAGGATRIDVRQDADDVEIAFDGTPLPAPELARLFDHLFRSDDRRARLLAIAVNTVLGLGPRWVDLYTREGDDVRRIRWTPALVDRALAAGAPLATDVVEVAPRTGLALPERGMLVHLRDRLGLAVVADFVRDRQPEVDLIATEARRLGARIQVDGEPLAAEPLAPPGRCAALELPDRVRGELALVPDLELPGLEIAEHGVVLDRIGLPCAPSRVPNATWPFRGWIDGEELPTNISRSQCDLSGQLGDAIRRALARAGSELVDRALASRTGETAELDEALLRTAIAALGGHLQTYAAGAHHALSDETPLPISRETLDRIVAAPLLPRATGGSLSIAELAVAADAGARPHAWSGDPLEEELAEVLPRVIVSRPGAVDWILQHLGALDAEAAVAQARSSAVRRRAWRRHEPRPPAASPLSGEVLRARFGRPGTDAPYGEIALAAVPSLGDARVVVTGWLDGRPVATEQLGSSPLPLSMALAGPGLVANPAFDGLEHDRAFDAAMRAGFAAAAGAVRHACGDTKVRDLEVHGTPRLAKLEPEERAALIRGAIQIQLAALQEVPGDLQSRLAACGGLADAPAWPTTDGRYVPTREVVQSVLRAPGAVLTGFARSGARIDGRAVLALHAGQADLLRSVLPPNARFVDCAKYLPGRRTADLLLLDLPAYVVERLPLANGAVRAVVFPTAAASSWALYHSGAPLAHQKDQPPLPGGAHVILEDDAAIPESAPRDEAMALVAAAEWELASRLADAVGGDVAAQQQLGMSSGIPTARSVLFLIRCAARLDAYRASVPRGLARQIEPKTLLERIRALPLIDTSAGGGAPLVRTSLDALAKRPGRGALPVLRALPMEPLPEGVVAVILPDETWDGELSRAIPRKLVNGQGMIEASREAAARTRARARLAHLPPGSLDDLVHDAAFPPSRFEGSGVGEIAIVEAAPLAAPRIELVHAGRILGTLEPHLPLPIHARIEVASEGMLTPDLDGVVRPWISSVQALIEEGVAQRVRDVVRRCNEGREPPERATELVVEWVSAWTDGRTASWQLPRDELASARLFRSVRGRRVSVRECMAGHRVRYATMAFPDWLPEPGAKRDDEPDAIHVPTVIAAAKWTACLGALALEGAIDVTEEIGAQQRRRRALHLRGSSIALPGAAPIPALASRIETIVPRLGVGEMRLLGDAALAGIDLSLFREGSPDRRVFLPAPIAVAVAVDSPLLSVEDIAAERWDALVAPILDGARALVAKIAAEPQRPDGVAPVLRWYLLSADAVADPARQLPAFADTMGQPFSRADLDRQSREHGVIPYVSTIPSEPIELGAAHGRALVLAPHEVEALRARVRVADVQGLIDAELSARIFDRSPPADTIEVRQRPKRALRIRFEGVTHGVEGEVALWPPWTEHASWVEWYFRRRPLGTTPFESPWPAQVALEWPGLRPNARRDGPIVDEAVTNGLAQARAMVRAAIDAVCMPPPETTRFVRIPDDVPGTERVAVGCAWLAASPADVGLIAADALHGAHTVRARVPGSGGAMEWIPVSGRLLLREPPEGISIEEHVESALPAIWKALLERFPDAAFRPDPPSSPAVEPERVEPPALFAMPVIPVIESTEVSPEEAEVVAILRTWGIPRAEHVVLDRDHGAVASLLVRADHTSRSVLAAFVLGVRDRAEEEITAADQLRAMDRLLSELSAGR